MKIIVLIFAMLVSSSCAHRIGVVRSAQADQMPPPSIAEVLEVLRAVSEVKQVSLVNGDRPEPVDRRIYEEQYHVEFGDLTILVQFEYREKQSVSISSITYEPLPSRHYLEYVTTRIDAVGKALMAAFPGFPEKSAFRETIYDGS